METVTMEAYLASFPDPDIYRKMATREAERSALLNGIQDRIRSEAGHLVQVEIPVANGSVDHKQLDNELTVALKKFSESYDGGPKGGSLTYAGPEQGHLYYYDDGKRRWCSYEQTLQWTDPEGTPIGVWLEENGEVKAEIRLRVKHGMPAV